MGETLHWTKRMTSMEAGKYFMTAGFVPVERYNSMFAENEQHILNLKNEIEELITACADWKRGALTRSGDVIKLQEENKKLKERIEEFHEHNNVTREAFLKNTKNLSSKIKELEENNIHNNEIINIQIPKLKEENETLKSQLEDANEKVDVEKAQNVKMQSQLNEIIKKDCKDVGGWMDKCHELESQLAEVRELLEVIANSKIDSKEYISRCELVELAGKALKLMKGE